MDSITRCCKPVADVGTGTYLQADLHTQHTHMYTHMQTWTPMDILVCPNSSHDPAGVGTYRPPTPTPTAPAPHRAWGQNSSWNSPQGVLLAQAGPRPELPLSPQDWKEKYIHENYTKALAGKMVEMVRPQHPQNKAADLHPAALRGTDAEQQGQLTWGGAGAPFLCSGAAWGEGMHSGVPCI